MNTWKQQFSQYTRIPRSRDELCNDGVEQLIAELRLVLRDAARAAPAPGVRARALFPGERPARLRLPARPRALQERAPPAGRFALPLPPRSRAPTAPTTCTLLITFVKYSFSISANWVEFKRNLRLPRMRTVQRYRMGTVHILVYVCVCDLLHTGPGVAPERPAE